MGKEKRINFMVTQKFDDNLEELSERLGANKSEIIRRSVELFDQMEHFINQAGYSLEIKTPEGESIPLELGSLFR